MNTPALFKSIRYALSGFVHLWRSEQNFRIQLVIGVPVLIAAALLPLATWQRITLILLVVAVWVLEIVNSVFERLVDILKSRLHPSVRDMKDMMATAVLLVSLVALVVGTMVLYPAFVQLWMS